MQKVIFCKIKPVINDFNEKKAQTLLFAAWELQKYLEYVLEGDFPVITTNTYKADDKNTIYLGVDLVDELEKADDPFLDDNILIDVENFNGIITGTNPRSVLIGVYRFLKEKGYVFLRPGKDGEVIPDAVNGDRVFVSEKASYRCRTICIEGTVYQENLMDTIDWIPKASMNGYMVQFTIPQAFFKKWYQVDSDYREGHEIAPEEVASMIKLLEKEIEKRDLQYHSIGHGWTSKAFGMESTTWESSDVELTDEQRSIMAQVKGKRGLWNGSPMLTHICLSNKEARDRTTEEVIKHLKIHNNVTHLHFWLADGNVCFCECDECQKMRVSDYYVKMLNELDEKLTAANMDTKIVFCIGYCTLWPPLQEKIKNPDRFILMFAPITRKFSEPLKKEENTKMAEYELNNYSLFPKSGPENMEYLSNWQKVFEGDCVDFDYHFVWDQYKEFSHHQHSRIVYEDMKNFKDLNLNGLISCQAQRSFTPTTLGMNVMARTLWNRDEKFEDIENETLFAEFGENYRKVIDYLGELSKYNCKEVVRGLEPLSNEKVAKDLEKAVEVLDGFEDEIKENIENAPCDRLKKAWEKLHFHNRLYRKMIECYRNYYHSDKEAMIKDVCDFAKKHEMKFRNDFDAVYFCWVFTYHIIKMGIDLVEGLLY